MICSTRVLVLTVVGLAGPVAGQAVQLKEGTLLIGRVEAPHEAGLTFHRLDNGGVLELRWDQLSLESQTRLKTMYNLSVDEESEYTVPAIRLKWELSGGGMEQVIGHIVAEDDTTITIRRRGVSFPVPRAQIKEREDLEVPALDLYTETEFYTIQLAAFSPGDDADKHVLLADVMMRVRDYERAGTHLQRANELGGGSQPTEVEAKLDRLKLFREAKTERELLDRIRAMLARKQFGKGATLIAEFEQKFPDSKLAEEFARVKRRFGQNRDRFLVGELVNLWSKTLFALARKKATEAGFAFDAAKDYAESQMGQDIRARVSKLLEIDIQQVEELWGKRIAFLGARSTQFHYGIGSWTLGAQAVLVGTKQEKAEAETGKKSAENEEMERILQRIRRAQERAKRALARTGSGGEKEEKTPEDWWEAASVDEKKSWLRAYYVEFGGDYEMVKPYLTECGTCAGEGTLLNLGQTGPEKKIKCGTCHGTRFKRWMRAH